MDLEKSGNRRHGFDMDASKDSSVAAHAPRTTIIPSALDEPFLDGGDDAFLRFEFESESDSDSDEDTVVAQLAPSRAPSQAPPPLPLGSVSPPQPSGSMPPPRAAMPSRGGVKDKWYLRVQLRKEHLADLWVRDLTPHNVLAWSDGMETWVPLLAVPELRDAIRTAQDQKTRDLVTQRPIASPPLPVPSATLGTTVVAAPSRVPPQVASTSTRPLPGVLPPPSLPSPALTSTQSLAPLPPPSMPAPALLARSSSAPPVPVVDVPKQSAAPPALPPGSSTRPPVPRSIAAPIELRPSSVPPPLPVQVEGAMDDRDGELKTIPHPARLPVFVQPFRPAPVSQKPVAVVQPALPNVIVPIEEDGPSQPKPMSLSSFVPIALPATAKWTSLVNLERLLWLAAGISVATATSFALHKSTQEHKIIVTAPVTSGFVAVAASPNDSIEKRRVNSAGSEDAAKVEQLPLVHGGATRVVGGRSQLSASTPRTASERTEGSSSRAATLAAATESAQASANKSAAAPATRAAKTSDGSFDPGQARRVLASAASRARGCASGSFSGSVQVTFAPSGFVQGASLSGLTGEGVRSGCVLRAFQEARVSPFNGAPVAVRKSFSF